jgi:hypothetical protein
MEIERYTLKLKHASASQRMQIVEQFRRSDLTREAFSRQDGVPLATLKWWLTGAKRASQMLAPVTFSEVKLISPMHAQADRPAMEAVGPSGASFCCREALA